MINVLLIVAGVLSVYMGITGRYQQALAAIVTGWRPTNAGNSQHSAAGSSGGARPYAL